MKRVYLVGLIIGLAFADSSIGVAQEGIPPPKFLSVVPGCSRLPAGTVAHIPVVHKETAAVDPTIPSEVEAPKKGNYLGVTSSPKGSAKKVVTKFDIDPATGLQTARVNLKSDALTVAFRVEPTAGCDSKLLHTADNSFGVTIEGGLLKLSMGGMVLDGPPIPTGSESHLVLSFEKGGAGADLYLNGNLWSKLTLPAGAAVNPKSFRSTVIGTAPSDSTDPSISWCAPRSMGDLTILGRSADSADVAKISGAALNVGWCTLCCQHELQVFNAVPNTTKAIELRFFDPLAIINVHPVDSDDFTVQKSTTNSGVTVYRIEASDGGFFPSDSAEAFEAAVIELNAGRAPVAMGVHWLDATGQNITYDKHSLACPKKAGNYETEDNDWHPTIHHNPVFDPDRIAFTLPQSCDTFDPDEKTTTDCNITSSYQCNVDVNELVLESEAVSGDSYLYTVDDDAASGGSQPYTVNPATHIMLPGDREIGTVLDRTTPPDNDGHSVTQTCNRIDPVCIPSGEFDVGVPQPVCQPAPGPGSMLVGWDVAFTPRETCNTASHTWNYADGHTDPFTNSQLLGITHRYDPIDMTYTAGLEVEDKFGGCIRHGTQQVRTTTTCEPSFTVSYKLCGPVPTGMLSEPVNMEVTITNTTHKLCDSSFVWNVNGGTDFTENMNQFTQIIPVSDFSTGTTITMKMTDSACAASPVSTQRTFLFKGVEADMILTPCGDGLVHFRADTDPANHVHWDIAPSNVECVGKMATANSIDGFHWKCHPPLGILNVSLEASKEDPAGITAKCEISDNVTVEKTCCEDFKVRDSIINPITTTKNNKKYKMKFKHKLTRPFLNIPGGVSHNAGKTKFKVQKHFLGIPYWKGIKADKVEVITTGIVKPQGADASTNFEVCACRGNPLPYGPSESVNNNKRAKFSEFVTRRGFDKPDLVFSKHIITYDKFEENGVLPQPWQVYIQKSPGQVCDNDMPVVTGP